MPYDVDLVRKKGYSDETILNYLARTRNFNLDEARQAGHQDADILTFLAKTSKPVPHELPTPIGSISQLPLDQPFAKRFAVGAARTLVPLGESLGQALAVPDLKRLQAQQLSQFSSLAPRAQLKAGFNPITEQAGLLEPGQVAGQGLSTIATAASTLGSPLVPSGIATVAKDVALGGALGLGRGLEQKQQGRELARTAATTAAVSGLISGAVEAGKAYLGPKRLMKSALRPTPSQAQLHPKAIEGALQERILIGRPEKTLEKVKLILEDYENQIEEIIKQKGEVDIPADEIAVKLSSLKDYWKNALGGEKMVETIEAMQGQIMAKANKEGKIPAWIVQRMKRATYRLLSDQQFIRSVLDLPGGTQATRAGGRALKESLEEAMPVLKEINQKYAKVLDLSSLLAQKAAKANTTNLIRPFDWLAALFSGGLGGAGVLGGASWAVPAAGGVATFAIFRRLLGSPQAKSAAAIIFNELGQNAAFQALGNAAKLGITALISQEIHDSEKESEKFNKGLESKKTLEDIFKEGND